MDIAQSIDIDAPQAKVWTVLTNVECWPEWTVSVTSVARLAKVPFDVGSQARLRQPRLPVAVWTVTATAFARRPAGPAAGGDGVVMLSDAFPECGGRAPPTLGGSAVSIHLDVDDVDAFFHKAVAGGAMECKPVMDQLSGDRSGQREDPFGHL